MRIQIQDRALLKVSGGDAESFLQAQLTNDITLLENNTVQLNAYCQHQGKVISLFWVMRSDDEFLLSFPVDLAEKVISRLRMFIIISEVLIEDISEYYAQIGLLNEVNPNAYIINESLSLLIVSSGNIDKEINSNDEEWIIATIESQIPEVYLSSSEKFIPQMLNLDINEIGVNFSKGCYPGQEVVARLHYLGETKRRLFAFKSDSEIKVGDSLYCASSKTAKARGNRYKGSGTVVNSVKFDSAFYCLATLDIDLLDSEINLNNEHGPILEIINNE
jgi:folate-binding protein YgfZ